MGGSPRGAARPGPAVAHLPGVTALARDWAGSNFLTVRISQIESRILSACANMVADIGGTRLNGAESNLVLGEDSIPVRGAVSDG